jgi:hypothetical protein
VWKRAPPPAAFDLALAKANGKGTTSVLEPALSERSDRRVPQAKSCHPERSKIIREANDLAESRDLLFALATTTRVERTLLSAAFDVARHHPIGVIPSAALLQAERGISRASPRLPFTSFMDRARRCCVERAPPPAAFDFGLTGTARTTVEERRFQRRVKHRQWMGL